MYVDQFIPILPRASKWIGPFSNGYRRQRHKLSAGFAPVRNDYFFPLGNGFE